MDKARIALLKEKNLLKNKIKQQNLEQKLKHEQIKVDQNNTKLKIFATQNNKHRKLKINNIIHSINKKYLKKITKIKRNLALYQKQNSPKLQGFNYFINPNTKIDYYKFRIKLIEKAFDKKFEKINHKINIALISQTEGDDFLQKLNIDKTFALLRWDKLINKAAPQTFVNRTKTKIQKLNIQKNKEILTIEQRLKSSPVFSNLSLVKQSWENTKSRYIGGYEIRNIFNKISNHFRKYSMFYILGFIITTFAIATEGKNLTSDNLVNIIENNTYILFIGLGMLLVIVAGYIDLSVGALMGFLGALSVKIYNNLGQSITLTLMLMIIIGIGIGFFQGFLIGYLKMPAFIVTLGGMLLFQGLVLTLTQSFNLTPFKQYDSSYIMYIIGSMPDIVIGKFRLFSFLIFLISGLLVVFMMFKGRNNKIKFGIVVDNIIPFILKILLILQLFIGFGYFIATSLFGLKYYIIYLIMFILVFIFLTQNTSFGRMVYAVGGNKKAAELSGINASLVTTIVFMIIGGMCGLSSVIYTAIASSATPSAGVGYELDVISSVFVGGASMSGGIGTITGTVIGGFVLGYINNGMLLMNMKADMIKIVKAVVLVSAVGYDIYANRKIG